MNPAGAAAPAALARKASPAPFPWREAMRFGFGVLRLSPRDFWSLSPHELAAASAAYGGAGGEAPARAAFLALAAAFPDARRPTESDMP